MKKVYLILTIITVLILVACKNDAQVQDESDNEKIAKDINNKVVEATLKQFPDEVAERIITTSVPIAEILDHLDVMPVGVPTSTNPLPEAFTSITAIGSPMAPDLEVITDLESDLIISASALEDSLEESLASIDLNRVYLPTDSYSDLKTSLTVLGKYFDKTDEMNETLDAFTTKEKEIKEKLENETLPSVLLIVGTSDAFMVMSEDSYLGSLINLVGADNIASSTLEVKDTYSPINMENIVAADPEMIFVLSSLDHGASEDMFQKEVAQNNAWKKLSAYQNDQIHILDYSTFGVTSINRVEQGLEELVDYFKQ